MHRASQIAIIPAALVIAWGCSRQAVLVGRSVEVAESPIVARFEHPVQADVQQPWEMCFEFDLPGDSHNAAGIRAVLVSSSGQRHPLVDTKVDRRGDSLVCQVGRVDAFEPGSRLVEYEGEVVFEAVELRSSVRLRLRELRGGSL